MIKRLFKKITVVSLLAATMTSFYPVQPAEAFLGGLVTFVPVSDSIQLVGHSIQGSLLGIDSTANTISASLSTVDAILKGIPLEYGAVRRALSTASTACDLSDGSFVVNLVDDLAASVAGMGDSTKATGTLFIGRRLALLNAKLACYTSVSESYQTAMAGATFDEQIKKAFADVLDEIEQRRIPINVQITDLQEQQKTSIQDIFKAIAISIALDINEQYTAKTVNELKPKLALGSYGKTIDALASQVYAVEYIKKNYDDDKAKQLIMTSFLDSELVPDFQGKEQALNTAKTLIEARMAEEGCPSPHKVVDYGDNKFLMNLANYGDAKCNAEVRYQQFRDEFTQLMGNSKTSAQAEVTTGNGFKSTRTCNDVTAQERDIRTQTTTATQSYKEAAARVKAIIDSGKMYSQEYVTAAQDMETKRAALNQVPQKVGGGIVVACGLISDPGQFVAGQLNNYVEKWLNQQTELQDNNLPLFANLAKSLSRKLFRGIILNPGQSNEVMSELGRGFVNASLGSALANAPLAYHPTNNQVEINNGQITNNSNNLDSGILTAYIAPEGQTTRVTSLTPGQEYDLVVDISRVRARLNTDPLRFSVVNDTGGINLEGEITAAERTRGNFRLGFTANQNSGSFQISVYGRIAPNPNIRLATTSVNYQAGTVSGAVTAIPLVPYSSPRGY